MFQKTKNYCRNIDFRGYFPKGGGEVELNISPVASLSSVSLTKFGSVVHIWGRSYVAGILPINVKKQKLDIYAFLIIFYIRLKFGL